MNFDEVYVIGCDSNWETATNTTKTEEGDINHFHLIIMHISEMVELNSIE